MRVKPGGTPNADSMLYAAAWRAAQAHGCRRLITLHPQRRPHIPAGTGPAGSCHPAGIELIPGSLMEGNAVIRCYVFPLSSRDSPAEADPARLASAWTPEAIAGHLSRGLTIAPGVHIALLSLGKHWQSAEGQMVHGALFAVQTWRAQR